jgi:hypothetical protein
MLRAVTLPRRSCRVAAVTERSQILGKVVVSVADVVNLEDAPAIAAGPRRIPWRVQPTESTAVAVALEHQRAASGPVCRQAALPGPHSRILDRTNERSAPIRFTNHASHEQVFGANVCSTTAGSPAESGQNRIWSKTVSVLSDFGSTENCESGFRSLARLVQRSLSFLLREPARFARSFAATLVTLKRSHGAARLGGWWSWLSGAGSVSGPVFAIVGGAAHGSDWNTPTHP